ncbi:glycosyltransferase family 2 protein [Oligoflexia bacterium]|nr:glycosyltransferase family 2 protein [Oligoflexia bacterium]
MSGPELCIVMPAYNEEGCIANVVKAWCAIFDAHPFSDPKLIVVNDGSKDNTAQILDGLQQQEKRLVAVHQVNAGHGRALRSAYEQAAALDAQWVFHVDSDDQFVTSDFMLLWEQREASHFILGYRKSRFDAFHRLVITRILRAVNLVLFGRYVIDANVPFRLIEGGYLKKLLSVVPDTVFAPNIFLSILAALDGQDIMHIPVHHQDRQTGTVSIVKLGLIKACLRCVKELALFRLTLKESLRKISQEEVSHES